MAAYMKQFSMFEAPDGNLFSHSGVCDLYSNLICDDNIFCIFFDIHGNIIPKTEISDNVWSVFVYDPLLTRCLMLMLGFSITGITDECKKVYSWEGSSQTWISSMSDTSAQIRKSITTYDDAESVNMSDRFDGVYKCLDKQSLLSLQSELENKLSSIKHMLEKLGNG